MIDNNFEPKNPFYDTIIKVCKGYVKLFVFDIEAAFKVYLLYKFFCR